MSGSRRLQAGVCSVTFRDRPGEEVVELAAGAGLRGIEWGGDVHVRHGDLDTADRLGESTRAAGLAVTSYGSYLFADGGAVGDVAQVLDTAAALGTDLVRVWTPFGVEPDAPPPQRSAVAAVLDDLATSAAARGMCLYLEFHGGTLTATARSAADLLDEVGADNLFCAWQPPYWAPRSAREDTVDLALLADRLAHVHVYAWLADGTRRALATEEDRWPGRLGAAAAPPEPTEFRRAALLEFVVGDDPVAFAEDARTLRRWLDGLMAGGHTGPDDTIRSDVAHTDAADTDVADTDAAHSGGEP